MAKSKMGDGYGSECHLLRFMGRHRHQFNEVLLQSIGSAGHLSWLDFPFAPKEPWPDAEVKGLDFFDYSKDKYGNVLKTWRDFWPQRGEQQNWDAVGVLTPPSGTSEWLLVEAKANIEEIRSDCSADPEKFGWPKIEAAFKEAKQALGAAPEKDWMHRYYQYANRLAILHFLNTLQNVPARLLFIYFVADRGSNTRTCPADAEGWSVALAQQDEHLGLPPKHALSDKIHKVFLNVVNGVSRSCS